MSIQQHGGPAAFDESTHRRWCTVAVMGLVLGFLATTSVVLAQSEATNTPEPGSAQPPVSSADETPPAEPAPAATQPLPQPGTPLLTLPRFDADAAIERYFQVDLTSGDTFMFDRVRRDPLSTRRTSLNQNLLELIGRPAEPAPVVGELLLAPLHEGDDSVRNALLVESSTGYVAYFEQLGRGNQLGTIRTTMGRPFDAIMAADGNFALLPRRSSNGRTVDAILYHATTGRTQVLRDIERLPSEPESVAVEGLPILEGTVAAAALQRDGGGTDGYVLFDSANGAIHRVGLTAQGLPTTAVTQTPNLFEVFPRDARLDARPRFIAVPILAQGQRTRHILLIDVGSGTVAWLRDIDGPPSLRAQPGDLLRFLTAGSDVAARTVAARTVAAVPRTGANGETLGAWLTDGLTGRVLYLSNLDQPDTLSVGVVTVQR